MNSVYTINPETENWSYRENRYAFPDPDRRGNYPPRSGAVL